MKFGPRKPNLKKRVKARTTGKLKRKVKKSVNPLYGKKGMGWVNNPKKAAYNKVYNKTTFDAVPSLSKSKRNKRVTASQDSVSEKGAQVSTATATIGCFGLFLLLASFTNPGLFIVSIPLFIYSYLRTQREKKEQQALFEKEKANHELQLATVHKLAELQDHIDKTEKLKTLDVFFERFNEIIILKGEAVNLLNKSLEKEILSKDAVIDGKKEIEDVINKLLKDYIKMYEERSFEGAMRLKTEKGQKNNYQRSYEDLQQYSHLFTKEIEAYIDEQWQNL